MWNTIRFGIVIAAILAFPQVALGQSFSFYPYDQDNDDSLTDVEIASWVNRARCLCDSRLSDTSLNLRIVDSYGSYTTDEVYLYLGDDCDSDSIAISKHCYELEVINHSDFNQTQTISIAANLIVDPLDGECDEYNSGTSTVYVIMEDPGNEATATYTLSFDTKRPGVPEALTASPGEQSVTVSWDPPDDDDEDIAYYDVLCSQGATPVRDNSPHWLSTELYCGLADEGGVWAGCTASPTGLVEGAHPSPCYVCGSTASTGTSVRISGLDNHQAYQFAVVAVDDSGNPSYVSEVISATPVSTTDFAEAYAGAGGKEKGGFCFVATELYGSYDHPEVRKLRRFRDEVLARSTAGRQFISWYYRHGRGLARLTRHSPALRALAWLGAKALVIASELLLPEGGAESPAHRGWPLPTTLLLAIATCVLIRLHDKSSASLT